MITYNQYPQLGVRQRPLAVTCLSWRDFLRKQDLLYPASTGSSWYHYRHLGPPLISWLCPSHPPTLDCLCFSSFSTLMSSASVILFYLKQSAPFQVIWISFHNLLKEIKFNRLDDLSLRDCFVESLKNIFIQTLNFVICFYEYSHSCHTHICLFHEMSWKHIYLHIRITHPFCK